MPLYTDDNDDVQKTRKHAEELKWYVHAGDLDPATECLGASKQETRIKGAQRLPFAEDHRRERDEPAATGHVGEKLADLLSRKVGAAAPGQPAGHPDREI